MILVTKLYKVWYIITNYLVCDKNNNFGKYILNNPNAKTLIFILKIVHTFIKKKLVHSYTMKINGKFQIYHHAYNT